MFITMTTMWSEFNLKLAVRYEAAFRYAVFLAAFLVKNYPSTNGEASEKTNLNASSQISKLVANGVAFVSTCETEVFNASCPHGMAILMTHAQYGRMRIGRCVRYDYGHVGCSADVIELADERCSGRPQCDIAVPDGMLSQTQPCPEDLKPYLEAGYNCIDVETPNHSCSANTRVPVTSFPIGYLASYVTELMGCGSLESPWLISATSGQTIHVALLDFASAHHRFTAPPATAARHTSFPPCPVYSVIAEVLDPLSGRTRNMTVCGGGVSRHRHVYSSLTNQITVGVAINELIGQLNYEMPYYLLKYEVTGCPSDIPIDTSLNELVSRTANHLIVKCVWTRQEFHLKCVGNRWVGDLSECNLAPYSMLNESSSATRSLEINDSREFSQFVFVVTVTACAIGLLTFIIGILVVKRLRALASSQLNPTQTTSSSSTPLTAKTNCPVAPTGIHCSTTSSYSFVHSSLRVNRDRQKPEVFRQPEVGPASQWPSATHSTFPSMSNSSRSRLLLFDNRRRIAEHGSFDVIDRARVTCGENDDVGQWRNSTALETFSCVNDDVIKDSVSIAVASETSPLC